MKLSSAQRKLLRLAGTCLALAGMTYVGVRINEFWSGLSSLYLSSLNWSVIIGLIMFYGGANVFLALAWWSLLRHHDLSPPLSLSTKVFGISQLAKYIPGNIAHFAGRQVLAMSHNMAGGPVAKSLIWELALLAVAAAQFVWIVAATVTPSMPYYAGIACFCASVMVTSYLCQRLLSRHIRWSFIYEVLFFIASAFVFASLAIMVLQSNDLTIKQLFSMGGAFIVAWLVGFVTPGAPAGIGVREAVLLHLLMELVPETQLLLILLLSRLTSVLGDLLFFLISLITPTTSPIVAE